jgi:hypothetical protein
MRLLLLFKLLCQASYLMLLSFERCLECGHLLLQVTIALLEVLVCVTGTSRGITFDVPEQARPCCAQGRLH